MVFNEAGTAGRAGRGRDGKASKVGSSDKVDTVGRAGMAGMTGRASIIGVLMKDKLIAVEGIIGQEDNRHKGKGEAHHL